MATITRQEFSCDKNGCKLEVANHYQFSFENLHFEADLCETHNAQYIKAVEKLMQFGRRAKLASVMNLRNHKRGRSAASRRRSADIREWAHVNGYPVSDRGRMSETVVKAYENAH